MQHVAREPLGTLDPLLRERGFRIRYVNFERDPGARPSLDRYAGIIVLGGPMHAMDDVAYPHLNYETELIRAAVGSGRPVLGICLGAQLLARALGASVQSNAAREIGWHRVTLEPPAGEDALFRHFEPVERIFQWHADAFDVPEGATLLAASERCPHQAFRYGPEAYGLQFHLEVDPPLIERWTQSPAMRPDMEATGESNILARIEADTPKFAPRTIDLSRRVFGAFVDLFDLPPRRVALPSGH